MKRGERDRLPLTITIQKDLLNKFKKYCEDNDINISKKIERFIKGFLERGDKK